MMIDEVPIRPSDQPDVRLERQLASARLENSPDRGECRQKRRGVRQVLEEITAHDIDRVGGDVRRQLMTGREHFFGAWREHPPGQRLDIDRDAAAAADVPEELAEPGGCPRRSASEVDA